MKASSRASGPGPFQFKISFSENKEYKYTNMLQENGERPLNLIVMVKNQKVFGLTKRVKKIRLPMAIIGILTLLNRAMYPCAVLCLLVIW